MALVRWNPFQEMDALQRRMNDLFDESVRHRHREGEGIGSHWAPRVDVAEDENGITLAAELPGLDKKDIHIHLENGVLTIAGERDFESEEKKDHFTRVERFYGSFSRSFNLPSTVDQSAVNAKMDKGVLTITLPKREEAKPKQIEVKVS